MDRDQQRLGSVVQWLSSTDLSEPTIPRRRRKKRKRSPTGASAVPDSLEPSMAAPTHHQSTPGRKKRIQETSDVNATPRAVGLPDDTNSQSISLSSLSDAGSIATSTTSRRSSPIKQLRAVSLFDDGFIHRKFTNTSHPPPPELAALAQDLETIGMGVGVLPRTVKPDIESSSYAMPGFCYSSPSDADRPGTVRTLAWSEALKIMQQAHRCELQGDEEVSWNAEVHHHLLRWVFRPAGESGLVDFRACTSATISTAYRPRVSPHKLVDFAIFVSPEADKTRPAASETIKAICKQRATLSINHIDYPPFRSEPIVVSVGTKRPDGDINNATLQLGTWHAAQFRNISAVRLLASSLDALNVRNNTSRRVKGDTSGIEFLPGILIHGHVWYFVASTPPREPAARNTGCLYTKIQIGTTEKPLGVYSIVVALQRIKEWVETKYWPAFCDDVLGLDLDSSEG